MSDNFYINKEVLTVEGYEIFFTRFSDSIIKDHFKKRSMTYNLF